MASWPEFRPIRLLTLLAQGGVDFVVIGGVAVIAQASPRFTKDLDIAYATDPANLDALGAVLSGLGARLRGIEEDLPFVADARALRRTRMLTLTTPEGDIDLLADPPGAADYATMRQRATELIIDGNVVRVASIEDLLAMKRAAGRPQDLIDIESLELARARLRGS